MSEWTSLKINIQETYSSEDRNSDHHYITTITWFTNGSMASPFEWKQKFTKTIIGRIVEARRSIFFHLIGWWWHHLTYNTRKTRIAEWSCNRVIFLLWVKEKYRKLFQIYEESKGLGCSGRSDSETRFRGNTQVNI